MGNFAMLWNIDKMFDMLKNLKANNKVTKHFLIYAQK